MKRILITGGTGFIGEALVPELLRAHYTLALFTRHPQRTRARPFATTVTCDDRLDTLIKDFEPQVIINLAGEGIADARWTPERKERLRDSRIGVTRQLVQILTRERIRPQVMISGSAIGYYGDTGDHWADETTPAGQDFAARLCQDWEAAAAPVADLGTRLAIIRIGLVIGNGGLIKRLKGPFSLGVGGRLGRGHQWMSWIAREDLVRLIVSLIHHPDASGPFNAVAPNPVTNAVFTRALASALHRPALCPVPAWLLRCTLGEMAGLLLGSSRIKSGRLESELSLTFRHTDIETAITSALAGDLTSDG